MSLSSQLVGKEVALAISEAITAVDTALGRPPFTAPFTDLHKALTELVSLLDATIPERGDDVPRRRAILAELVAPGCVAAAAIKTTLPCIAMAFPKGSVPDTPVDQDVLSLFIRCCAYTAEVSTIPLAELVRAGLQFLDPPTGELVQLASRTRKLDLVTARHMMRVLPVVVAQPAASLPTPKGGGKDGPAKVPKIKGPRPPTVVASTCPPGVIVTLCQVVLGDPELDPASRTELIDLLRESVFNDVSLPNAFRHFLKAKDEGAVHHAVDLMADPNLGILDALVIPSLTSPSSLVPLLAHSRPSALVEQALVNLCFKGVSLGSTQGDFKPLLRSLGLLRDDVVVSSVVSPAVEGSNSSAPSPHVWSQLELWDALKPVAAVSNIKGVLAYCKSELERLTVTYPPSKELVGGIYLGAFNSAPDIVLFPLVMGVLSALSALAAVAANGLTVMKELVFDPVEVAMVMELLMLASLYVPRLPTLIAAITPPPPQSAKSKAKQQSNGGAAAPITPAPLPNLPTALSAQLLAQLSAPVFGMLWRCKFTTKAIISSPSSAALTAASIEVLLTDTLRVTLSRKELLLDRLLNSRDVKGDGLSLVQSQELASKVGAVLVLLVELYRRIGALATLSKGITGGFGPITTHHPLAASIGLALSANSDVASSLAIRGFTRHWLRFIVESRVISLSVFLDCATHQPFTKVLPQLTAAAAKMGGSSSATSDTKKPSSSTKGGKGGGNKAASLASPPVPTNIIASGGGGVVVEYAVPSDKLALRRILTKCVSFGLLDGKKGGTTTPHQEDDSLARLNALIGALRAAALGVSPKHTRIDAAALKLFVDAPGSVELLAEVYSAATPSSLNFLRELIDASKVKEVPPPPSITDEESTGSIAEMSTLLLDGLAKIELEKSRPPPPHTLRGGGTTSSLVLQPIIATSSCSSSIPWGDVVIHVESLKNELIASGFGAAKDASETEQVVVRSQALIDALQRRKHETAALLEAIAKAKAKQEKSLRGKLKEQARVQEAVKAAFEARMASQEEVRKQREEKRVQAFLHAKDLEAKRQAKATERRKAQLQAAKEREGLTDSLLSYLESAIRLPRYEALTIVNRLRPQIAHLSADDVHEYIVSGHTKVPADMLSRLSEQQTAAAAEDGAPKDDSALLTDRQSSQVRSNVRERYFADANGEVSFWDMVERATREEEMTSAPAGPEMASCVRGEAARHEASKQQSLAATQDAARRAKIRSMSFHYRVSLFLDSFDFSTYDPEDPDGQHNSSWNGGVAPLTRDSVQAVFPRETSQEFGFFDAGSCAFELSQHKLITINKGVYSLTPLGAAYHARFANPSNSFEAHRLAHLAQARAALGLSSGMPSRAVSSSHGATTTHGSESNKVDDSYYLAGGGGHQSHTGSDADPSGEGEEEEEGDSDDDNSEEEGPVPVTRMFFTDELI